MNRQQIKLLAIASMTLDHIALVFVPTGSILYHVMRMIGRLTAPLMSFMLAEGYRYTRSRQKYLLRLVIFALISQPFYFTLAFGRAPNSIMECCTHWNVMFTLMVALMSLMLLESKISVAPWLILVGVCISLAQFGDWSYMIPVWTMIFHVFRNDKRRSAALFTIVSVVLQTAIWLPQYDSFAAFSYQYGTLLALVPIQFYNGKRCNALHKNLNRWFFYVYYSLHIAVLLMTKILWHHA